jgi:hypothetical protein
VSLSTTLSAFCATLIIAAAVVPTIYARYVTMITLSLLMVLLA